MTDPDEVTGEVEPTQIFAIYATGTAEVRTASGELANNPIETKDEN